MTNGLHMIVMDPKQTMHLGVGRGSGFSAETRKYVPGSAVRGALSAAWWRAHPSASQADFDSLIATISCSDAVVSWDAGVSGPSLQWTAGAAALDRKICKLCKPNDPGVPIEGFPWDATECRVCRGPLEPSKGNRVLPRGAEVLSATRVELNEREQAKDDHLYEREGLNTGSRALVALAAGRVKELAKTGQVLRIGAATSVAGRLAIADVVPYAPPSLAISPGKSRLRVEMLTPGVFVDEFGCAVNRPTTHDLRWSFQLPETAGITVERAFTRWTTASGWHTMANRPKPEDIAVVAHSCFYVRVEVDEPITVPTIVHDLGIRTGEGCGWASLSTLLESADA